LPAASGNNNSSTLLKLAASRTWDAAVFAYPQHFFIDPPSCCHFFLFRPNHNRTFPSKAFDRQYTLVQYIAKPYMPIPSLDRELKKGSAELLILSLVEDRQRHGYEISKLIESRSEGALRFNVASLYPMLYRMEKRGWIQGRWVDKAGQRRRRYYRLTAAGRKVLRAQRSRWQSFVAAINQIAGIEHA
jgi:PadR family transcriptional regulator, regulatory protein PadR